MNSLSAIANPIFCAIDTPDLTAAQELVVNLGGAAGGIKLGKEFFTAHGPAGLPPATGRGHVLFPETGDAPVTPRSAASLPHPGGATPGALHHGRRESPTGRCSGYRHSVPTRQSVLMDDWFRQEFP